MQLSSLYYHGLKLITATFQNFKIFRFSSFLIYIYTMVFDFIKKIT